jgi:two-component system response regulator QseB
VDELASPSNPLPPSHSSHSSRPLPGRRVRFPLGVPVLVAEHDTESRHIISLTLAEQGYTLHHVSDGAAALDFLRRARPPLVILAEEELPEIGGFQLAGLLGLKRAAESRYSVIVLTADLRSALRQSMYRKLDTVTLEVLVKPFHVAELLMAVDMAAERLAGRGSAVGWSGFDQTAGGETRT